MCVREELLLNAFPERHLHLNQFLKPVSLLGLQIAVLKSFPLSSNIHPEESGYQCDLLALFLWSDGNS